VAQKKDVRVQIESSLNSPYVIFDVLRMKQVLLNLLTNAIEASPEGETVIVSSFRKRGQLIIDVRDHGCGISHDKRGEIYSPFFTTKNGGTGLGLPITKKIVEAHQGRLEVFDNTEKGVTFRVVISISTDR
jgi:signal transduction histidine kinase